jgi:hypothetical protein
LRHLAKVPNLDGALALDGDRQPEPVLGEVEGGDGTGEGAEVGTDAGGTDVVDGDFGEVSGREEVPVRVEFDGCEFCEDRFSRDTLRIVQGGRGIYCSGCKLE